MECNLVTGVPRSVAALLPPNLQTLCLWYEPDAISQQDLFVVSAPEFRHRLHSFQFGRLSYARDHATAKRQHGPDSRLYATQWHKCELPVYVYLVHGRFTCMWACHWQGHSGSKAGLGALVGNLLGSLPLLRAPLRSLILQRGKNAPMLGAIKTSCADLTVCLTCIAGNLVPSFPFAEYHLGFSPTQMRTCPAWQQQHSS